MAAYSNLFLLPEKPFPAGEQLPHIIAFFLLLPVLLMLKFSSDRSSRRAERHTNSDGMG